MGEWPFMRGLTAVVAIMDSIIAASWIWYAVSNDNFMILPARAHPEPATTTASAMIVFVTLNAIVAVNATLENRNGG